MAKNRSHIEERNSGMAYQLKQSYILPFVLVKVICIGLGFLLVVGQLLPLFISVDFYRCYDGQRFFSLGNGQH